MAFDLYFAGRTSRGLDAYLYEQEVARLFSYGYGRDDIFNWCKLFGEQKNNSKLFIDSGAYSAYTKGEEINVDEYIQFVNEYDKEIDIFVQLDKIPGKHGETKTREDILLAPAQSWENYLYMRERVVNVDKLLPVFHRREDFSWLEKMLEATFDGGGIFLTLELLQPQTLPQRKKQSGMKRSFLLFKRAAIQR